MRELAGNQDDNVTVKYHALISDGVTSAVREGIDNRVITGQFKLIEDGGNEAVNRVMTVSAHNHTWSNADNDPPLRDLITTNTRPQNSYIISKLNNIRLIAGHAYHGGQTFVDAFNHDANEIITVHSLLTPAAYTSLRQSLHDTIGQNPRRLPRIANGNVQPPPTLRPNNTFRNSLKAYRTQVAQNC